MFSWNNSAEPTPEIVEYLKILGLSPNDFPWYDVPSLYPPKERISRQKIQDNSVDVLTLLDEFLGNKVLTRSIRVLDLLTGCNKQCDVCLAKAALPSTIFSYEGLYHAFQNREFLNLLQPDSLRSGSAGDSLDHPQAPQIFRMILEATDFLEYQRNKKEKHHVLKIFANFRPLETDALDEMLQLALDYPERVRFVISLPVMKNDTINDLFRKYASDKYRRDFFKFNRDDTVDGKLWCVVVQDVRHYTGFWRIGRVPDKRYLSRKGLYVYDGNRRTHYEDRGLVKVYLNPDALWLFIYGTMKHSSTARIFTPLNDDILDIFSYLPWHPHFPTPPNWPGGKGQEYSIEQAKLMMEQDAHIRSKSVTVVK